MTTVAVACPVTTPAVGDVKVTVHSPFASVPPFGPVSAQLSTLFATAAPFEAVNVTVGRFTPPSMKADVSYVVAPPFAEYAQTGSLNGAVLAIEQKSFGVATAAQFAPFPNTAG